VQLKREHIIYYATKYGGNYRAILKAIRNQEKYEEISNCNAITIIDEDYPDCFWHLQYPPLCLFYLGNKKLLKGSKIGIVGSRNPLESSISEIKVIVKNIKSDYYIVSGLAKGIDGYAHRAAIAFGLKTIGILANGINYCYPLENRDIYQLMTKEHLVVSEYPADTKPQKHYFPFRNRLIACLSDKLIIADVKMKSGTMVTVDLALSLNREIYCMPTNIFEQRDNNQLIKQGANIICCLDDIRNI